MCIIGLMQGPSHNKQSHRMAYKNIMPKALQQNHNANMLPPKNRKALAPDAPPTLQCLHAVREDHGALGGTGGRRAGVGSGVRCCCCKLGSCKPATCRGRRQAAPVENASVPQTATAGKAVAGALHKMVLVLEPTWVQL
jgi:hypothetical protein